MKWNELEFKSFISVCDVIAEGKTKSIHNVQFKTNLIEDVVMMKFKDDITAGDGVKHDVIEGKAAIDWKVNKDIYEFLNRRGINTHYISSPGEKFSIVKKLDQKINLEVVTRRVATGSILKHTTYKEGNIFSPTCTQFFYKDDFLHDPLLDEKFLTHLANNKNCYLFREMIAENVSVFCALEEAFAKFKIQLVDIKLEYGIVEGRLTLIDEITGGSFRLWPYREGVEEVNWSKGNGLDFCDPKGRLDKDLYRKGEATLSGVRDKFQEIASITDQFKNLDV